MAGARGLDQKVALITGASRGLGLAIAREYAERGMPLITTARGTDALERAAEELSRRTSVLAIAGDLDQVEHRERLVQAGLERFGRIDVLVNNASTLGPTPMPALEDYPLAALARVFRVNTVGPLHLAQLVLPGMRERGSGTIINVTSDAGVEAYAGWGGYGASKAALEHMSRTLIAELVGSGVNVYVVDPGDMNTDMHREADPDADPSTLAPPEAIAPAFVRLVEKARPSGRFMAAELTAPAVGSGV